MRILQINKFFYPKGGSETYFFDLSTLLESKGHQVIHFSMRHPENFPSPFADYFVDELDFQKSEGLGSDLIKFGHLVYSVSAKELLDKLIKDTRPDIAHIHNISHQLSPSILTVLKKYSIPVVQTLHDYQLICPNYKLFTNGAVCERCRFHKYYQSAINKCVGGSVIKGAAAGLELGFHKLLGIYEKNIDLFIAPSQFLRNKLIEWNQNPDQVVHLPHFFDIRKYQPVGPGNYVLFAGRLASEKGIMVLVEAAKALQQIHFVIAGDGEERQLVSDFIQQHSLKNIDLLGQVSRKKAVALMAGAKIMVLPSIWYENYSYSLLEACALGKAVIATSIGGNPEIIINNQTGLLVEPNSTSALVEAISRLYNNDDLLRRLGQNARERVSKINDPERHYQSLIEIYNQVI